MACNLSQDGWEQQAQQQARELRARPPSADRRPLGVPLEVEALQAVKDALLIVIGTGPAAERLARRRLEAGGRLCVVATERGPDTSTEWPSDKRPPQLWLPPAWSAQPRSGLGARLRALPARCSLKKGPDVVALAEQERLEVISVVEQPVAVRVTSSGRTVWELSGFVVLHPSEAEAGSMAVEVSDLEAKPLLTVRPSDILLGILVNAVADFLGLLVGSAFERTAEPGQTPWWRIVRWAPHCLIVNSCLSSPLCGLAFTGFYPSLRFSAAIAIGSFAICGVLVVLGASNHLLVPLASLASVVAAQVLYWRTRPLAPTRSFCAHHVFAVTHLHLTVGVSYAYFGIAQGYMGLLSAGRPSLASVFLPVMTSLVEAGAVWGIRVVYTLQVVRQREKHPGSVLGDIRPLITVVIALAHGWGEGTRMASLLSGAVLDKDDYMWVGSLLMSILLNVTTRTGWLAWLLSRVYRCICQDCRQSDSLSAIYWDIRFSLGYPRFAAPIILFLVRWLVYRDLDPASPSFPFFNTTCLVAVGLLLLAEIVEDLICHMDIPTPPCTKAQAAAYGKIPKYSLDQCFVPLDADGAGDPSVSCHPGTHLGGLKPHPALSLHGTRTLSRRMVIGLVGVIPSASLFIIELILGTGYVHGVCPSPVADKMRAIVQGFIVETPYTCI